MFEVYRRVHTATKGNMIAEYESVSVHDANSKTKRITRNSCINDANSILNSSSESVIARIGSNGAILKLATLIRDGWSIVVSSFNNLGSFLDRQKAEEFRDRYITNYNGPNIILGRPGFRFTVSKLFDKKPHTFHQPISGDTKLAVNRIISTIETFSMNIDESLFHSCKLSDGKPITSLYNLILYCSERNRDHNPSNHVMINNVRFEEGMFKNYGQIFRHLLFANLII